MKLAITAKGDKPTDSIDPRFGRSLFLVVYDTDSQEFVVYDNAVNLNADQGAGIQTAVNVAKLGVEAVITGNVGPNAFKTLNTAGIKVFLTASQAVEKAVQLFKQDQLKEVSKSNVEGHWI